MKSKDGLEKYFQVRQLESPNGVGAVYKVNGRGRPEFLFGDFELPEEEISVRGKFRVPDGYYLQVRTKQEVEKLKLK